MLTGAERRPRADGPSLHLTPAVEPWLSGLSGLSAPVWALSGRCLARHLDTAVWRCLSQCLACLADQDREDARMLSALSALSALSGCLGCLGPTPNPCARREDDTSAHTHGSNDPVVGLPKAEAIQQGAAGCLQTGRVYKHVFVCLLASCLALGTVHEHAVCKHVYVYVCLPFSSGKHFSLTVRCNLPCLLRYTASG